MLKKLSIVLLVLTFAFTASPQTTRNENQTDKKPAEKRAEIEKEAVAFLRETFGDAANLRTAENRIGFNAELAGLMWFHDEKQARAMFETVITDFKQMLFQLDGQLSSIKINAADAQMYDIPFLPASDSQSKLIKKFGKTMSVRQQIALVVSEHDPVLAHSFFIETGQTVTNPDLRKQFENRDSGFEMKLLQAIAEKDAEKGLDAARKSLAKGLNAHHIELLKKLYAKDAEKGAAFGEEIIGKIKSQNIDKSESFYYLRAVLSAAVENRATIKDKPDQKPMFNEQNLRDTAEMMAQILLKGNSYEAYNGEEAVKLIKTFLPARAVQIEQKMALEKRNKPVVETMIIENDENSDEPSSAMMSRYKKMEEQAKKIEDLKNLGEKKLPEEERKKVIAEARKMVAEIDDPNMRMLAVSGLAAQVAKLGDKETATEIMREAERFVTAQPKNYMEYMQNWMLASAYSEINAEKAFPLLEDTIFRLNDTISAFVKVGEFIDVNGDFIEDGEVQVSSFGGAMTNELLRNLNAADATIKNLANADFAKTKALTGKFDRTEVRVLAKMLVLRAILDKKKTDNLTEFHITADETGTSEQ